MSNKIDEREVTDEHGAARILGVSVKTMRAWRWRRVGPKYFKAGRRVGYVVSTLRAYRDQNTVETEVAQ